MLIDLRAVSRRSIPSRAETRSVEQTRQSRKACRENSSADISEQRQDDRGGHGEEQADNGSSNPDLRGFVQASCALRERDAHGFEPLFSPFVSTALYQTLSVFTEPSDSPIFVPQLLRKRYELRLLRRPIQKDGIP